MHSTACHHVALRFELATPSAQITRLNTMCKEYSRKQKAGEPLPPTLEQSWAKGELKLPFTKA